MHWLVLTHYSYHLFPEKNLEISVEKLRNCYYFLFFFLKLDSIFPKQNKKTYFNIQLIITIITFIWSIDHTFQVIFFWVVRFPKNISWIVWQKSERFLRESGDRNRAMVCDSPDAYGIKMIYSFDITCPYTMINMPMSMPRLVISFPFLTQCKHNICSTLLFGHLATKVDHIYAA